MILEMPDGQVIEIPDEYSMLMLMNNGRFGGTGIYFTPGAIMNDGLLDLIFHHGPSNMGHCYEFFKYGINGGGQHVYLDNYSYFRAPKLTLINRNFIEEKGKQIPDNPDEREKKKNL